MIDKNGWEYHEPLTGGMLKLHNVWEYLWNAYKDNGSVPPHISAAISLIQERFDYDEYKGEFQAKMRLILPMKVGQA